MNEHSDQDRLLKFPKEVLVDYFLRRQMFEIEWSVLERASLLYQYGKLLEKAEQITEQQREKGISLRKWSKLDEEYERCQKRMDSVRKRLTKLQVIGSERVD